MKTSAKGVRGAAVALEVASLRVQKHLWMRARFEVCDCAELQNKSHREGTHPYSACITDLDSTVHSHSENAARDFSREEDSNYRVGHKGNLKFDVQR